MAPTEDELEEQAAGEVLTAKQAPHRPGTAPALGLRAGMVAAAIVTQAILEMETQPCDSSLGSMA